MNKNKKLYNIFLIVLIILEFVYFFSFLSCLMFSITSEQENDLFFLAYLFLGLFIINMFMFPIVKFASKRNLDKNNDDNINKNIKINGEYKINSTDNTIEKDNVSHEMQTENICQKCGYVNPINEEYCKLCHAKLNKQCPKCLTYNDSNAKYCDNCGYKFDN